MKKEIYKYCLALVLNIVPFFLSCFLYTGGISVTMMLPFIQIFINMLNYKWTETVVSFTVLNLAMLISSVTSIKISVWLYYNNISSDAETLAVGDFEVQACVVFVVLMTVVSVICRIVSNMRKK